MNNYNPEDFTIEAFTDLGVMQYLFALVDSENHKAGDPQEACYGILYPLFECEAQVQGVDDLLGMQAWFLPENYYPQTPVMSLRQWSPIHALLRRGPAPRTLKRLKAGPFNVASGIWKPDVDLGLNLKRVADCQSDEELFWAIVGEVFKKAKARGLFVNMIVHSDSANYDDPTDYLPQFNAREVAKADRVVWKRKWTEKNGQDVPGLD